MGQDHRTEDKIRTGHIQVDSVMKRKRGGLSPQKEQHFYRRRTKEGIKAESKEEGSRKSY